MKACFLFLFKPIDLLSAIFCFSLRYLIPLCRNKNVENRLIS